MLTIPSKDALKPDGVGVFPDTRRGRRTSQHESFHPADHQFFAGAPFESGMMTNETTTEPEAEFVCVSLGGEEASVFLRFARRCKIPEAKLPTRTRLRSTPTAVAILDAIADASASRSSAVNSSMATSSVISP